MNRYLVLITAVISFAFMNTTIAKAEENTPEQEKKSIVQDPKSPTRPAGLRPPKRADRKRPDRRGRDGGGRRMNRSIMQQQQLEVLGKQYQEKQQKHDALIGRLNRILKSAQDEKATETVQLLEKLIEKQKRVFTESTKHLTKRRDAIRERMTGGKGQEGRVNKDSGRKPAGAKSGAKRDDKTKELLQRVKEIKEAKEPVAEKTVPKAEKEGKKKGFFKRLFGK